MPSPPIAGDDAAGRSKRAARSKTGKAAVENDSFIPKTNNCSNSEPVNTQNDVLTTPRANAPENPPWLSSQKPKLHHEQAVTYFFTHAPAASAKGQPLRFHMATGRIYVYGMIIAQDLKSNPGSRYVVFVPDLQNIKQTAAELRVFELKVGCVGDGSVFLEDDADVLVTCYDSARFLQGRNFRIKVVEEGDATKMKKCQHVYE